MIYIRFKILICSWVYELFHILQFIRHINYIVYSSVSQPMVRGKLKGGTLRKSSFIKRNGMDHYLY